MSKKYKLPKTILLKILVSDVINTKEYSNVCNCIMSNAVKRYLREQGYKNFDVIELLSAVHICTGEYGYQYEHMNYYHEHFLADQYVAKYLKTMIISSGSDLEDTNLFIVRQIELKLNSVSTKTEFNTKFSTFLRDEENQDKVKHTRYRLVQERILNEFE